MWIAAILLLATALQAQDYVRDVAPLLQAKCSGCHGAAKQMASLRLDEPSSLLKVVQSGKPDESLLIERITSTKKGFSMPPGGRLADAEIAAVRAWIEGGAKIPESLMVAGVKPNRSAHWAFQPIVRPAVPSTVNRIWARNAIDSFILAKLEQNGLVPAGEASRTTLLRRLSLDLVGLPPSPAEVASYLHDGRPDAYERQVDRLLASPHYGEKWARSWLDLARYADSDGYEKDQVRPGAWRYRHWVIDALNADMPYDQFAAEQLAGDLLPNATTEQLVATGFHRNVLTNREAGVDRAEARFEQNINRASTVGTVFLGLTVGCAQCHNHKFDPISQKEFYQLFAYVAKLEENDVDAPLAGEMGSYLQSRPKYEAARNAILKEYSIEDHQREWEKQIRQAIDTPGVNIEWDFSVTSFKAMVDNAVKLIRTDPAARKLQQRERLTNYFLSNNGPDNARLADVKNKLTEAKDKVNALNAGYTPLTLAMAVKEDETAPAAYIALGGDYKSKGADVEPGVPAAASTTSSTPRTRLEFARWLMSRENTLTSRVAVNRMWQELFGRGLVRTSEDFGTQGDKPSHPELLDWLASEFRDGGWSMKAMQRQIVLSAAYRQSSAVRPELLTRDPENILVARQSRLRLAAEAIRDSALAASGLLNSAIGGKSVKPPLPAGIAELGYGNSVKWVESTGPDRYRRGLYIHFQRTTPYPQLSNFDTPDMNVSCARRSRSNTPLQALNLLNDPVFLEAAQGLALRILREAPARRIDYAFTVALGRGPTAKEKDRFSTYIEQQTAVLRRDPGSAEALMPLHPDGTNPIESAAWVGASRVLLNLDEFITRE